ncbi:DNA-binding protein [Streptomyces sp. CB01881]|uniref:DNA-binding protein n=1 Tax=Streptomyces sp. CB01881 TaxID=2078691 RepID=UPI000CDC7EBA|nr:DNA-binding protein [Streptomyces sp. CB01881]AUY54350.1 DNA-binding protein [Streptomyces sp. CB01881]TYC74375.1 DNA-binding protein [Streptomyces sp. CB01881]
MRKGRGQLPPLYYPADIATAIGMSEWWVKEQARRGRIPFTKPGRAYRFTADQFAEIVRMYEVRPATVAAPQIKIAAAAVPKEPARDAQQTRPVVRLRARMPRRALLQQQDAA